MELLNLYRPRISTKIMYLFGILTLLTLAIILLSHFSPGTSDAVVILHFRGHLSFEQAVIALTALDIPTSVSVSILTSSLAAIGTGMLNAVIKKIIIAFLGFWDWIALAFEIGAITGGTYEHSR